MGKEAAIGNQNSESLIIFGAQGIALGAYRAIKQLYPQKEISCFIVSKRGMNAESLDGVPVLELDEYLRMVRGEAGCGREENNTEILIATPENVMQQIEETLERAGLYNHTRLTSEKWGRLMCLANAETKEFLPLDVLKTGAKKADIQLFMAKFYKDKHLNSHYKIPDWITPIQVGTALTDERVAEVIDSEGDNISSKNVNYSELTALYWLWKNRLEQQGSMYAAMQQADSETADVQQEDDVNTAEPHEVRGNDVPDNECKYYGLVHYRRILELTEEDLYRLNENEVDVVLPYPMPYLPDIHAHHERYLQPVDWEALLTALRELQPEYAAKVPEIFGQQYLYNYNIMLAKADVLRDYCRWLFPVLARTEELSSPKGWKRADRYIGYMGEALATLYFMVNKDRLNIVHKGCKFLI